MLTVLLVVVGVTAAVALAVKVVGKDRVVQEVKAVEQKVVDRVKKL